MRNGFQFTNEELNQIVTERLAGLLPTQVTKVAWGYGSPSFTFSEFTGKEPKPQEPARSWKRPDLAYKHDDKEQGRPEAEEREYDLRSLALDILSAAWREAEDKWSDAAWVVALKKAFTTPEYGSPVGVLWDAYREAQTQLDEAYEALDKLTDPAGGVWASAVSRLVKAQEYALDKAGDFDTAARYIAVIDKEYGERENSMAPYYAHEQAGGPAAKDWDISYLSDYDRSWGGRPPVTQKVADQIEKQDAHVKRVSSLLGQ